MRLFRRNLPFSFCKNMSNVVCQVCYDSSPSNKCHVHLTSKGNKTSNTLSSNDSLSELIIENEIKCDTHHNIEFSDLPEGRASNRVKHDCNGVFNYGTLINLHLILVALNCCVMLNGQTMEHFKQHEISLNFRMIWMRHWCRRQQKIPLSNVLKWIQSKCKGWWVLRR